MAAVNAQCGDAWSSRLIQYRISPTTLRVGYWCPALLMPRIVAREAELRER